MSTKAMPVNKLQSDSFIRFERKIERKLSHIKPAVRAVAELPNHGSLPVVSKAVLFTLAMNNRNKKNGVQ